MESKVLIYNSDDIKIGETFIRRARQLVRRQRAIWVNDEQTAIRFAPGMENMDNATAVFEKFQDSDKLINRLMPLAEKRMRERKRFVIHTFATIPLAIIFIYLYSMDMNTIGFHLIWAIPYIAHVFLYTTDKYARKQIVRRLLMETEMLKGE